MDYALSVVLNLPYHHAVPRVKQALQAQGFGTLTGIDVQATLKTSLGTTWSPTSSWALCNPQPAHQALDVDRQTTLIGRSGCYCPATS
jgi:uncharacterized protein (DUF302 family)